MEQDSIVETDLQEEENHTIIVEKILREEGLILIKVWIEVEKNIRVNV